MTTICICVHRYVGMSRLPTYLWYVSYQPCTRVCMFQHSHREESRGEKERSVVLKKNKLGEKQGVLWGSHCESSKGYKPRFIQGIPGCTGYDVDGPVDACTLRAIANVSWRRQNQLSQESTHKRTEKDARHYCGTTSTQSLA